MCSKVVIIYIWSVNVIWINRPLKSIRVLFSYITSEFEKKKNLYTYNWPVLGKSNFT